MFSKMPSCFWQPVTLSTYPTNIEILYYCMNPHTQIPAVVVESWA